MKVILVLMMASLAALPVPAGAVGRIAIFSDEALTNSELVDDSYRPVDLYVAHVDHHGVTGSQFRVDVGAGFTGHFLGASYLWAEYTGTWETGVSIYYAQCAPGDIALIRLTYFLVGTSSPCSALSVVPHPQSYSGGIVCVGCNFVELPCDPPGPLRVNCPVAVAETTWGRVKALYR